MLERGGKYKTYAQIHMCLDFICVSLFCVQNYGCSKYMIALLASLSAVGMRAWIKS